MKIDLEIFLIKSRKVKRIKSLNIDDSIESLPELASICKYILSQELNEDFIFLEFDLKEFNASFIPQIKNDYQFEADDLDLASCCFDLLAEVKQTDARFTSIEAESSGTLLSTHSPSIIQKGDKIVIHNDPLDQFEELGLTSRQKKYVSDILTMGKFDIPHLREEILGLRKKGFRSQDITRILQSIAQ
jgi:hypothetical protein